MLMCSETAHLEETLKSQVSLVRLRSPGKNLGPKVWLEVARMESKIVQQITGEPCAFKVPG